jgi:PKD repeat protein
MKRTISLAGALFFLLVLTQLISCKKEEEEPDVIASFTFTVDTVDFMKVHFKNQSSNFSALLWNFGDGSATSADTDPVHTFPDIGEFTVNLTATSTNGKTTDVFTQKITITDPNAELTKLVGEGNDGKVWRLIRDASTGRYPLEVGPIAHDAIWWAYGRDEDLGVRPCILNDEWTFVRDGSVVFDDLGDYWAEGSIYPDGANNDCFSSSDPMINKDNVDVSAWKSATHQFVFTTTSSTLQLIGNGAYIGLQKAATNAEVTVPQSEVTFKVIELTEGTTDTLIVETEIGVPATGYWRFVLVHYDNPGDEPPIPAPIPVAGFTYVADGATITFTNTSTLADSYSWDFGDGTTSTETDPVHVFPADGSYNVSLTATNDVGESTTSQTIIISSGVLTEEILTDGAWKLQVSDHACYVGEGMGGDNWWKVPIDYLNGGQVGTENDWSCMTDDEFIFTAGGGYEYKTNGGSRNDGYMGTPNGCWDDAQIAASPGAAFGSCATHTFTFTPAEGTSRAIIELTNGPGFAAFIGFMKGYYGGENNVAPGPDQPPPNGGFEINQYEVIAYSKDGDREILIVTVDISEDHSGAKSWTMELER